MTKGTNIMKFVVFAFLFGIVNSASGQISFVEVPSTITSLKGGSSAFADVDNDGDQDLMIMGYNSSGHPETLLYINDGSGGFTEKAGQPFADLAGGPESMAFGDVNGDGFKDVFIAGTNSLSNNEAILYINDGTGSFSASTSSTFSLGNAASVIFGDFVKDGNLDLFYAGWSGGSTFSEIYENDGTGVFTNANPLLGGFVPSADTADLNGNGFLDLVMNSFQTGALDNTQIYIGNGDGTYVYPAQNYFNAVFGTVRFADLDGEGSPDLFVTGSEDTGSQINSTSIYLNDGSGGLTEYTSHGLEGVYYGDVGFADLDLDGDQDLIMLGSIWIDGGPSLSTQFYLNDGSGTFELVSSSGLENLKDGSLSIADVDGDGISEVFLSGEDELGDARSILYRLCFEDDVVVNESACESYEFDGATLTASGSYQGTFTNQAGCDSLVTLNLTILNEVQYETVVTTASSYDFGGNTLTATGFYDATFMNDVGCDSLVHLNLTFEPDPATINSYTWFEPIMPDGTPQRQAEFDALTYGEIKIGDMDGDGDLDVVINGADHGDDVRIDTTYTKVYLNDGLSNFTEVKNANLTGSHKGDMELFDADGDGDLDVIQAGRPTVTTEVTTLDLNDGTGHFSSLTTHGLPNLYNTNIATSDLDDDGDQDVVMTGRDESNAVVSGIYLNQGNGEFIEDSASPLSQLTEGGLEIGDVNNDGSPDIVMAGYDASGVAHNIVYLNDGTGVLTEHTSANLGTTIYQICLLDVDQNNTLDVLIKRDLYLNDGTGTFTIDDSLPFSGFVNPNTTVVEDFNQDGIQDLLFLRRQQSQVLIGDGQGGFSLFQTLLGHKSGAAAAEDFNGDSYPEFLMTGVIEEAEHVDTEFYINDGTGMFQRNELTQIREFSFGDAAFADLDGDGDQDLITSGNALEGLDIYTDEEKTVAMFLNDGNGNYTENTSNDFIQVAGEVLLEDFDGDGDIDVLLTGVEYVRLSTDPPYDGVTGLYLNNGSGQFTLSVSSGIQEDTSYGPIGSADVDNDGDVDLVLNAQLMINNGTGTFTTSTLHDFPGTTLGTLSFGDANGDGYVDLFRTGGSSNTYSRLYLNDGLGGLYRDASNSFKPMLGGTSDFADIDGDGDLDLFVSGWKFVGNPFYEKSSIYFNDGLGNFTEDQFSEIIVAGDGDSEFADLDGDGDQDLVVAGSDGNNPTTNLYINNGVGYFQEYEYEHLVNIRGAAIAVADVDGDGGPDIYVAGYRRDTEARIYRNTICQDTSNDIEVEVCESYTFFGQELTASGLYTQVSTNGCGKNNTINLNLTVTPTVIWENNVWSNGTGPTTTDHVEIDDNYNTFIHGEFDMACLNVKNGSILTVADGSALNVVGDLQNEGSITVESGGTLLTYEISNITGNPIIFKRNTRYSDGRYSMVGSPVESNATITGSDLGPFVYSYNEAVSFNDGLGDGVMRWIDASSSTLAPGMGYAAAGQKTITFEGIPNDGTIAHTELSRTEDVTTTSDNWGWHLISNPYPAALDLNSFIAANTGIQGFIALWDDPNSTGRGDNGDYLIANMLGMVSGPNGGLFEGYIGSMQGFMVQVGDGQTGDVVFTESMRVNGNNADETFFRIADIPTLLLEMTSNENYSETLIGFPEDATTDVDRFYDALKLKAHESFNLYTLIDEKPYAIQGIPLDDEIEIPIGIDLEFSNDISFEIKSISESLKNYEILLKDNKMGHTHFIDEHKSTDLKIRSGVNQKRFSLILRKYGSLNIEEVRTKEFLIFTDNNYINIQGKTVDSIDYKLINIQGAIILKGENRRMNNDQLRILTQPGQGMYFLQIQSGDHREVHKLILK